MRELKHNFLHGTFKSLCLRCSSNPVGRADKLIYHGIPIAKAARPVIERRNQRRHLTAASWDKKPARHLAAPSLDKNTGPAAAAREAAGGRTSGTLGRVRVAAQERKTILPNMMNQSTYARYSSMLTLFYYKRRQAPRKPFTSMHEKS